MKTYFLFQNLTTVIEDKAPIKMGNFFAIDLSDEIRTAECLPIGENHAVCILNQGLFQTVELLKPRF